MQVLVFQHIDGEHPAAFAEHAEAAGDVLTVVRWHRGDAVPDFAGFDALLVMGGPMDVWEVDANTWLTEEIALIREWVQSGRPYLGICLGHQLLAVAMGGDCAKMVDPEIGIMDVTHSGDPAFAGLPSPFPAMHWHGVEVSKLPPNTAIIAQNPNCANQAMKVGANAIGVQFHPEILAPVIDGWMKDAANRNCAVDWLGSDAAADQFARDSVAHVTDALAQSRSLYGWLRH